MSGDDDNKREALAAARAQCPWATDACLRVAVANGGVEGCARHRGDPGGIEWRNAGGRLHREGDCPAVIWANGTRLWWRNGDLHRDGGQPAVIYFHGGEEFWEDGQRVRRR